MFQLYLFLGLAYIDYHSNFESFKYDCNLGICQHLVEIDGNIYAKVSRRSWIYNPPWIYNPSPASGKVPEMALRNNFSKRRNDISKRNQLQFKSNTWQAKDSQRDIFLKTYIDKKIILQSQAYFNQHEKVAKAFGDVNRLELQILTSKRN